MSSQARENKRKRKKRIKIILAIIIILYILFMFLPNLYSSKSQTVLVKSERIEEKTTSKAVVIKDENIYDARKTGKVKFYYDESVKVAKNEILLSQLDSSSDIKKYEKEIVKIEEEIINLNKEKAESTNFFKELSELENQIKLIEEKIKTSQKSNQKTELEKLNKELIEKKIRR